MLGESAVCLVEEHFELSAESHPCRPGGAADDKNKSLKHGTMRKSL
jgi:hypothetical protein